MKPNDIPFKEAQTKPSGVVSPIATISTPETTPPIKSNEIGDLAKRRGFKGGPLPTSPSRHSYLVGLPQSIKLTSIDTATPSVASPPAAPQSAPIIRNSNRSSSYFGLLTSTPSSTSASATAARIIRARNNFSTPLFHNRPPVSARKFFKNTSFMGLSINTNVNATTGLSTPSPSPSPSPRSPLANMAANLLLHSSIKPPSGDIPIPDALQELYTATDPFASSTKSFYVPNELFDRVEENPDNVDDITQSTTEDDLTTSSTKTDPNANLYDFSFYTEIGNPKPRRRSSKSSREAPTKDADKLASSTNAKASGVMKMKTTIYATYDEIAYGPECSNGGNASVTDRSRKDSRKLKPMDSLTRLRLMAESRARGETVTNTTSTGTNSTESESRSGSLASRPDNWVGKPSSGERLPEKGETVLVVQGPLTMAIAPPTCIETPKHNRTSVSSGEYDKDTLKQSGFKIIFTPPSVPGSPKSRHSRDSTSNTITGKWTLSSPSAPEAIQELEEKEDLVKEELAREKREVERKEKENVVPKTPSPRTKVKAKNRDRSQSRSKSRSRSRGGLGEGLGARDDPTEVVAPILDDKRDDSEVDQYGQAPHKFIKPRFNRHARSTPTSPTRSSSSTTAMVAGKSPSSSRHGHGHSRFKSRSRSTSRGHDSVQGDGTPQTRTRTPAITQQSPKGNSSRSAATDTMSPPPPPAMAASRPLATSTPPPPPAPNQTPSRTWNIPRSPALSSLHYASIPPSGGVSTQNMDSDGKLQKVYRTAAAAAAAASFDMGNTSVGSTTSTLSTGSGGAGAGGLKRTTSRFGGEGRDRIKPTRPSMGTPNNGPADISGSSPSPTTLITPVGENKLRGPAADFEDTLFDSYYSSDMASPVLKVRSSTTMTPVAAGGMSVLPPSPVMEKNALGELGLTSPSPSPSPGGEDDRNASSVAPPLKLDLGTPRVFISEKMKKGHKTLKEKWSNSSLRREMRKGLGRGDGPPVVVDAPSGGGIVNPNPNPNLNPKKTRSMPLYIGTIPMVPMPMRMPTRLPVNNSFNVGTGLESVDEVDGIGMFSEEEGQEEEDRGARDRQEQPKYKLVVVNRTNETPRSSLSSQSHYTDDEDPFSSTPDPGPLAFVAGGSAPEAPASSRRTSGGSRFADVPAGSRPESQYSGTGSATSGSSFAYMVRERTAYYEDDDDEEYREFGLSVHLDPFERLGMAVLDEELGELEGDSDGIDDILMRTGRGG
ncbi:hypothetical protein BDN72DRAFT_210942 [Pluteus cervinus]|uniref:Uncharacterized protein n=1 Tax=Pluteus cervinus TaxID=181527 RepID=A0ACD3B580_9AGAR|nr:hypothetical protein BDN72DRAFT_210942 [Pluteus cervinus]